MCISNEWTYPGTRNLRPKPLIQTTIEKGYLKKFKFPQNLCGSRLKDLAQAVLSWFLHALYPGKVHPARLKSAVRKWNWWYRYANTVQQEKEKMRNCSLRLTHSTKYSHVTLDVFVWWLNNSSFSWIVAFALIAQRRRQSAQGRSPVELAHNGLIAYYSSQSIFTCDFPDYSILLSDCTRLLLVQKASANPLHLLLFNRTYWRYCSNNRKVGILLQRINSTGVALDSRV